MTRYFTQYWTNETWNYNRNGEGELLNHIAGNLFKERGVKPGDIVYVVTVIKGKLYLLGKMKVAKVYNLEEAGAELSYEVWEASDHLIAAAATPTDYNREVPLEVTKNIKFISGSDKNKKLKFKSELLDTQTLRGVRELAFESATQLDEILPPLQQIASHEKLIDVQKQADSDGSFNPVNIEDARKRVERSIVLRRGQSEFRSSLLEAYNGCCAITGCNAKQALEAAHIIPYRGDGTNHPSNGLLLRSDIHTLFDLYLITVYPETKEVCIAPELRNTSYGELHRKILNLPLNRGLWPSEKALEQHYSQRAWSEG